MEDNKVPYKYVDVNPDIPPELQLIELIHNREKQLDIIRKAEDTLFEINLQAVKSLIDAGRYDLFTVNWNRIRTQIARGSL